MSGGKFGPAKAPERRCLPLEEWPSPDRIAWTSSLMPVDPFSDSGGQRSDYRPHSSRKSASGYGRWLTFVNIADPKCLSLTPGERITKERVIAYVLHMQSLGNKKNTVLCRLQELVDVAKIVAPLVDCSFVARIASKVRSTDEEPKNKRARLETSDRLLQLGLDLMGSAHNEVSSVKRALRYRDGLLIAMLSLVPMRRSNVVDLALGRTLVKINGDWLIRIPGDITKNHTDLEFRWPDLLKPNLKTYIELYRPILACRTPTGLAKIGDQLWASSWGSALTEITLYNVVAARTKAAFGRPINPHLFRDAAATSMAIFDPEHVQLAAPLLGHRSFATTERYYQQAKSVEASREFGAAVEALREANKGSERNVL